MTAISTQELDIKLCNAAMSFLRSETSPSIVVMRVPVLVRKAALETRSVACHDPRAKETARLIVVRSHLEWSFSSASELFNSASDGKPEHAENQFHNRFI